MSKRRYKYKLRKGSLLVLFMVVSTTLFLFKNIYYAFKSATVEIVTAKMGHITNVTDKSAVLIRNETPIYASFDGKAEYIISEGERVKQGSVVGYLKSWYTVEDLNKELQLANFKLSMLKNGISTASINKQLLSAQLELNSLYADAQSRILHEEREYLPEIKSKIEKLNQNIKFLKEQNDSSAPTFDELRTEKQMIINKIGENQAEITAPSSGVLSFYSDGLEKKLSFLTKDKLSVKELKNIKDENKIHLKEPAKKGDPIGKIVYNYSYYMACEVDEKDIDYISSEKPIVIYISEKPVSAVMETFYKDKNKKFIGLFRIEDETFHYFGKRCFNVKIRYSDSKGIMIPKKCVFVDENNENAVYVIDESNSVKKRKLRKIIDSDKKHYILQYNSLRGKDTEYINLYDRVIQNPSSYKEGQKI